MEYVVAVTTVVLSGVLKIGVTEEFIVIFTILENTERQIKLLTVEVISLLN